MKNGSTNILFILLTVFALSAGQILFKIGSQSINPGMKGLIQGLLSPQVLIALTVYAIATVMWLVVLKNTPLRLAYPFVALAFFIVPIFGHFFLGEKVQWNTFAGAALILAGVWLSIIR